jgi:cytochrome c oxidase subunit II
MTAIIILLCFFLVSIVLVQIGKVTELTAQIKGERAVLRDNSKWNAGIGMAFMVVFLISVVVSAYMYRNTMLGYGPHESASAHGASLDSIFNVTLFFTGIVFVLTHIALFWFSYKYRYQEGRKAEYIVHDNRLEVWWTLIPAVVMAILVVRGLNAWNTVMADVKENEDYMEIEATAQQFGWIIRYPGPDGKLGTRDYRLTTGANTLGLDFNDPKGWDDVVTSAVGEPVVLPLGKKIRTRIIAKDVLHNFYLPHFRVKMDAVPGMPTYFVFTPTKTTSEYRQALKDVPEFQVPYDPKDPTSPKRWENFDYELACAELCGKGHFSMRRIVKIVTPEEYNTWYKQQQSFYLTQIHNKSEADDPFFDKTLPVEAAAISAAMDKNVTAAIEEEDITLVKPIRLDYIHFATGSANLTDDSKYELDALVDVMTKKYPTLNIALEGHTDNVGNPESNQALSMQRAEAVVKYLTDRGVTAGRVRAAGYGDTKPVGDNTKADGRRQNRRVEFRPTNRVAIAQESN